MCVYLQDTVKRTHNTRWKKCQPIAPVTAVGPSASSLPSTSLGFCISRWESFQASSHCPSLSIWRINSLASTSLQRAEFQRKSICLVAVKEWVSQNLPVLFFQTYVLPFLPILWGERWWGAFGITSGCTAVWALRVGVILPSQSPPGSLEYTGISLQLKMLLMYINLSPFQVLIINSNCLFKPFYLMS